MSLKPQALTPVPKQTAQIARSAFPKGSFCLTLRDEIGTLFSDALFADLFPTRGQPAEAPWRLMLVTVLQFVENLTDRQAAEGVRARIDWKYLLGLDLTDPGFDASVLCEFRARLVTGQAEARAFEHLLRLCQERGWLKARGRQRTDSTHVVAAIRTLNRLESLGETLRQALEVLAVATPDWLAAQIPSEWGPRYARRFEDARLPAGKAEREALGLQMLQDGYHLLEAVYAPQTPAWLAELPAVETLRQVWVQQGYREGDQVRLREPQAQELPPAATLIQTPYDLQAHYSVKKDLTWVGYQLFLTETCDPDRPHLITQVTTTPAPDQDLEHTAAIQADLKRLELLPAQQLVDARFLDAELLHTSQTDYQIDLVGPLARSSSWQSKTGQGYDETCFDVDWEHKQATCPQGQRSRTWKPSHDIRGNPIIDISWARSDCQPCVARSRCTRAKNSRRKLSVRLQPEYEALQRARTRQRSPDFATHYAPRAGIEGTFSQGVRRCGLRECRYRGQAKTHLQHVCEATALNLIRLVAWLRGVPLARTRSTALARLALSA